MNGKRGDGGVGGQRPGGGGRGAGRGGAGRGRMGGGFRAGPSAACVCPQCGHREPHKRGIPCYQNQCPQCGTAMIRE